MAFTVLCGNTFNFVCKNQSLRSRANHLQRNQDHCKLDAYFNQNELMGREVRSDNPKYRLSDFRYFFNFNQKIIFFLFVIMFHSLNLSSNPH